MPADEIVDVVDKEDRVVGAATLQVCLERGLLHRAVAVIVQRGGGRVLLQQRNKRDAWHPGLWTLSCTGHVKQEETYAGAARRELSEELGLRSPVKAYTKVLIPTLRSRGLIEREWVTLFVSSSRAPISVDPVELERVEEVPLRLLPQMLHGRKLTPDAKILLRNFMGKAIRP